VHIYCDESGGVGRGVMTLAALSITDAEAEAILHRFRAVTGVDGEIKGSRVALGERALLFELLEKSHATATVGVALSATRPAPGEDRGDHDVHIYTTLLEDVLGAVIPAMPVCEAVVIDDGRYSDATLADIRARVGKLVGPFGTARLELSHRAAGLQLADIIANTFFTRALPGDRQARMAAIVAPMMASGRLTMRVLMREPERQYQHPK